MENITPRQIGILKLLTEKELTRAEIEEELSNTYKISKTTTFRDLTDLIELGYIEQKGAGPATYYTLKAIPNSLPIFDIEKYFNTNPDSRNIISNTFNSLLINEIDTFFTKQEISEIEKTRTSFSSRIASKSDTEIKKELERFIIELSWKSSQIEGNTYTLLDTENLIKNNIEAHNHTKEEKIMILNHKYSFDYILKNINEFKEFNIKALKEVHSILVKDLDIKTGYRTYGVGISGTKYLPLDNAYQIEDAVEKLEEKLDKIDSPILKAFGALLFISYIQPFADGNKRTARMISNSILLANNFFPLSYRSVDEVFYKKAILIFYEQNNIYYFKQIFKEQYKFSMNNYFI